MRACAFRRGVCLLGLVAVLSGCSSAAKKQYLRHLTATIAPVFPDEDGTGASATVVTAPKDRPVVVVTPVNGPRP